MSAPLSPERVEEIRARLKAATPGPWEVVDYNRDRPEADTWLGVIRGAFEILDERFQIGRVKYSALRPRENRANAELIANAPADLAALLTDHARLVQRVEELEAELAARDAYETTECARLWDRLDDDAHTRILAENPSLANFVATLTSPPHVQP